MQKGDAHGLCWGTCVPSVSSMCEGGMLALPQTMTETATANFLPALNQAGFPGGSDGKESACNAGGPVSFSGLGRSFREGNGNLLQYSCLENPIDRGTWRATIHSVTKSQA